MSAKRGRQDEFSSPAGQRTECGYAGLRPDETHRLPGEHQHTAMVKISVSPALPAVTRPRQPARQHVTGYVCLHALAATAPARRPTDQQAQQLVYIRMLMSNSGYGAGSVSPSGHHSARAMCEQSVLDPVTMWIRALASAVRAEILLWTVIGHKLSVD